MAPAFTEPEAFVTVSAQRTSTIGANRPAVIFAFVSGGIILLGIIAYSCFLVIGQCRRRRLAQVEEKRIPLPLVLPTKVDDAAKAPKRLILSPRYVLPQVEVDPVEDLEKDDTRASEDKRHSRRWSLHARKRQSVEIQVPLAIEEGEDGEVEKAQSEPLGADRVRPHNFTYPGTRPSYRLSLDLHANVSPLTSPADQEPICPQPVAPPTVPAPLPRRGHTRNGSIVVDVIPPHGAAPGIVVEDFTPLPALDEDLSDAESELSVDEELLQIPRKTRFAPRTPKKQSCQDNAPAPGKTLKKKSSLSKLVAALGDISNAARRRPRLPSAKSSPKKTAKRASSSPARSSSRSLKEN